MPYLHRLGISHLYLSPIFAATPGSTHGYDVLDHNQVNPELGGLSGLYALGEELRSRDMGLILDIVPNHVGIALGANPWWRDVLRYGRTSKYAAHFDIDWEGHPEMPAGVLVYPILGQSFGQALEAGELRLELEGDDLLLRYFEHSLPLAPHTYPALLGLPPLELREAVGDPSTFAAFVETIDALPAATTADQAGPLLDRFRLALAEPAIEAYVGRTLASVNGTPGDPASLDRLEALLAQQHYSLTYWRVSGEALNYRRFFDINDLPAIRVEREDVFEEVHRLLFELVARGIVTGVRVDHVDGLYDPAQYLRRLRSGLAAAAPGGARPTVHVEKILEAHETLPPAWEVEGTTGYDFAAMVDGLFVDQQAEREMSATHVRFTGVGGRYHEIAYLSRRQVAETSFAGEINVLAVQLHRIAQRHRLHRDHTLRSLRDAIATTLACFPVYRTYVVRESPLAGDRASIRRAVGEARERNPSLPDETLGFLTEVLLLEGELSPEEHDRRLHWRRRFQQVSGPVVAKGIEDTAFYRYTRLISLNEVGGDPAWFGTTPGQLHEWLAARANTFPGSMSAGSTHDSKRGEDVRARIHVLSEIPARWRSEVRAWARANRRHKQLLEGELTPDANTEYYLYQTLVGVWPSDSADLDQLRERIGEHLQKAIREAKVYTSWQSTDRGYEEACGDFAKAILDPARSGWFVRRLGQFVASIEAAAAHNGLAALFLRALAPGFPDFYQGCEAGCTSLTDPDNRRPVDFTTLSETLDGLDPSIPPGLGSPGARLWFSHRLLCIRVQHRGLLASGAYRPLDVAGERAGHVFAFARSDGQTAIIVTVPRLTMQLLGARPAISPEVWADTRIRLPEGFGNWRDELGGRPVGAEAEIWLREAPGALPFVVLAGRRLAR